MVKKQNKTSLKKSLNSLGKKGFRMTLNQIVMLILVLASFFLLTAFAKQTLDLTDQKSQEELCRASVFAHHEAAIRFKVLGFEKEIKPVPIICNTATKKVPLEYYDDSKKGTMQSIGELTSKCWRMFGEGFFGGDIPSGIFASKPCHVCYDFTIDETALKDKDNNSNNKIIYGSELRDFLFNTPHTAYPEWHETECSNGKDDDSDGYTDDKDIDCQGENLKKLWTNCEVRGGECMSKSEFDSKGCPEDTERYDDLEWNCNNNKEVCCVEQIETYADYIEQGNFGKGVLKFQKDVNGNFMDFTGEDVYGIAIVLPKDSSNMFNIEDPSAYHIYIGKYDEIGEYCQISRADRK